MEDTNIIDTRTIDAGSKATVSLSFAGDLGFAVKLTSPGTVAEVYVGLDRAVALDAYRHPFARKTTPDVFTNVPDDVEADAVLA